MGEETRAVCLSPNYTGSGRQIVPVSGSIGITHSRLKRFAVLRVADSTHRGQALTKFNKVLQASGMFYHVNVLIFSMLELKLLEYVLFY